MLEQYKEAIEKSNIISKTDINGIITFVNDEFCKISGYTKEELIGQKHNIVRHPDVSASKFKLLLQLNL
jgi:PAS domain S-box-containing protein